MARWGFGNKAMGALLTTAAVMATGLGASPTEANGAPPATISPGLEVRQLVQQGLAMGLASNVLQSQVPLIFGALSGGSGCVALTSGPGSSELAHRAVVGSQTTADVDIYYGAGCAHPYIKAAAVVTTTASGYAITDHSDYLGLNGHPLGSLKLTETAALAGSQEKLYGTGHFTPQNGGPVVSLGLTCDIPPTTGTPPPFICSGGIAQSFPVLGVSLASVTSLALTLRPTSADQYKVSLASAGTTLETGPPGALSITVPTPAKPLISGTGTSLGTDTATGQAGSFALFPATPTTWSVTDKTWGVTFSVRVLANGSRDVVGQVSARSGATLARLSMDRSGTGTLTYADGARTAVTSWTLAG
jgi:hypothetical protein